MTRNRQACTVCVMDDAAGELSFDENGQCNCCRSALARAPLEYFPNEEGKARFDALAAALKAQGAGRKYDCMIGLSGGIDSAYLAHILRTRYDLRLLAVHIDGGWNSEAAVSNIESVVRTLDIDLYTYVVEWDEIRDVQLAFLRSGVLNQDMPQDHAFFAMLYRLASTFGIHTFLSGVNFATESIVPPNMGHPSIDGRHVRAIHKRFGKVELKSYPILTVPDYLWLTRIKRGLTIHRPLNWIDFSKSEAKSELMSRYRWKDYGTKHGESRFTRFYQQIYLPRKILFDKRRLHLSSLIVSKQISREAALEELRTPVIDADLAKFDIRFVAKKLNIDVAELCRLIDAPLVSHAEYPNDSWMLKLSISLRDTVRNLWSQPTPVRSHRT